MIQTLTEPRKNRVQITRLGQWIEEYSPGHQIPGLAFECRVVRAESSMTRKKGDNKTISITHAETRQYLSGNPASVQKGSGIGDQGSAKNVIRSDS